jgi:hypothetical protein
MRKAAGLTHVRFHDGRHTAITTLAEKGLPDWVIQPQVGHVAPEMMKTYSHIRREALTQAAAALERRSRSRPSHSSRRLRRLLPPLRKNELCHNPCHKSGVRAGACSIFRRTVARRTGRFPQLADPFSGLSPNQ